MEAKPYKIPHPFRKLTKELIDILCDDIERGSPHKFAAEANGATEAIFNIWRNQGVVDIEHEQYDTLPAYLVASLAKIKQKEVQWCRKAIKSRHKGHKGAEWTLEHAYWQHYSNNAPVQELQKEFDELKNSLSHGESDNEANDSKKKKGSKE